MQCTTSFHWGQWYAKFTTRLQICWNLLLSWWNDKNYRVICHIMFRQFLINNIYSNEQGMKHKKRIEIYPNLAEIALLTGCFSSNQKKMLLVRLALDWEWGKDVSKFHVIRLVAALQCFQKNFKFFSIHIQHSFLLLCSTARCLRTLIPHSYRSTSNSMWQRRVWVGWEKWHLRGAGRGEKSWKKSYKAKCVRTVNCLLFCRYWFSAELGIPHNSNTWRTTPDLDDVRVCYPLFFPLPRSFTTLSWRENYEN